MEEQINNFINFIKQNPEYFYLIISGISLLFFIGSIKKWDWILNKSGNYYEQETGFWINIFGEKLVRLFIALFSASITIISFLVFFYYK